MANLSDIPKAATPFEEMISKLPIPQGSSDNLEAPQSLTVVRKLSNAKFPVYLAFSKTHNKNYAMKVFPYIEGQCNKFFNNEARFAFLKHPNVVNFVHSEEEKKTMHKGKITKASYILMDYASHGDFFNFITNQRDQIDDKLARTYFRQMIEGIEFLHENGVAHLDLKPENLLIGDDYNLKIIDFDLSYIQEDQKVLSNGTKHYRAPEFFRQNSSRPGSKSTYAADIYSAGIILFILKSRGIYPHAEDDGPDNGEYVDMMYQDNYGFWEKHCEMEERDRSFYDRSFRQLFNNMVKEKPHHRWNLKQIKKSKWYNGPVYSPEELHNIMEKLLNP